MKRTTLLSIVLLSIGLAAVSCNKGDNPTCVAGPDGETELTVFALHNGDTLIHSYQQPDTIFLTWSDAGDPPNPSFYNKYYIASPGEDHVHVHDLKCGTYRVRLSVYDSVSAKRLTGNNAVSFTSTSGKVPAAINVN